MIVMMSSQLVQRIGQSSTVGVTNLERPKVLTLDFNILVQYSIRI